MGILLGAPVWYGNRPFKKTIEELYKLGLDYIEFSLDYPLPDCMHETEREELKILLEDFGLKIGFHSPLDTPLAHPRAEIADAGTRVLRKCMDFSAGFHPLSLYYNFHLHPRIPTYKLEDVRAQIKENGLRRCEEITGMASEFDMVACVENDLVPYEWSDLILEALSLFYPTLQLTFDVGHAIKAEICHPRIKGEDSDYLRYLRRWIESCGAKILVTHVHDCSLRGKRDHLSLNRGDIDFTRVFELLKTTSCKYLLIEAFWQNKEKKKMDYEELGRSVELCRSYF